MTAADETTQAPSTAALHQLALRVAVLGVRADDAKQAYEAARKAATPAFAAARKTGTKQQAIMLPGGVEAGLLALKAGSTTFDVDEAKLLQLIAAVTPSETEEFAAPAAASDPRVIDLLAEHAPDLLELQVKPGALTDERAVKVLAGHAPDLVGLRLKGAARAELQKYLEANEGYVPDPATGEPVKVAEVTHHDPSGSFSWTGKEKVGMPRVRAALESGQLIITETGDVVVPIAGEVENPAAIEGGEAV